MRGPLWCHALLLLSILTLSGPAVAEKSWTTADPAHAPTFRITGVVTSSRGVPVPRCSIRISPAGTESGISDAREDRRRPGGRPPGVRSGQPGEDAPPDRERITPGSDPSLTTISDSRGHFTLAVPHAGTWVLSGTARDYRQQRYQQHDQFSTALVLSETTPELHIDLVLKASASLNGFVLDEFGDPVANGQVVAQRRMPAQESGAPVRWQSSSFAATDDRGHYELTNLADGEYRLAVSAQPWYASGLRSFARLPDGSYTGTLASSSPDPSLDVVFPVTWFPGSTEERSASLLNVRAGEDLQADFHLQAIPAIHLTIPRAFTQDPQDLVADGLRQGRGGVPQLIRQTAGSAPFGGNGQFSSVNRDGTWELGGLSPGTYQLRLPDGSGGDRLLQLTLSSGSSATAVNPEDAVPEISVGITLDGADASDLRSISLISLATGTTYSGNQRGRFGNAGLVRRPASTSSDDDQEARSIRVPPGDYFLAASLSPELSLSSLSAAGAQVSARTIHITDGTPVLTLHVKHGRSRIAGTASQAGKPSAGAMVLLVPAGFGSSATLENIRRDQSASDGSYSFRNVPAGPYILVSIAHGWDVQWQDPATLAKYLTQGTPLNVQEAAELQQPIDSVEP